MALRALGSRLYPRFWQSRIRRAQRQAESPLGIFTRAAPCSAAERPVRSLYTMRDLAFGDGVYGTAAIAGFAGLFAILYFTEKSDGAGELTNEECRKEVAHREAVKEGQDDGEATMKARFQDWMKRYGRSYDTEEEKAWRFVAFKKAAILADKANAKKQRSIPFAPNGLADWTEEELKSLNLDFDSEKHDEHLKYMAAHGGIITIEDVAVTEAVKQKRKELAAREKARRQSNNC